MKEENFDEIVENLFLTVGLIKRKVINHSLLKGTEITSLHMHILFTVKNKGVATVSELAKQHDISKPNITPLIQKLIDKGFMERFVDEKDRRYVHVKLTAAGKEFLTWHKEMIMKDLKNKLIDLSEADLEKLGIGLQYLKEILGEIK